METCNSIPVKNSIVPVLHLQIVLGNHILNNLLDFIDSDVENLSTGEKVSHNTLVILNQVVVKRQKNRKMWDFNDHVML